MKARHLPMLLCLCISQAFAAERPINLHHPAAATAHIKISNVKGAVNVTAWDRNEVQVTGRLGDGAQPLEITGSDHALAIEVQAQGKAGWLNWHGDNAMAPTTLDLHVPSGANLEINVVSAPVGMDGMRSGRIAVRSVSGRTRINGSAKTLDINSVSGSIELAGHADKVDLETVSGDILAPVLGDEAQMQTVSGRVQASGGPWRKFSLSTVSGDVQLRGGMAPGGTLDIDSMSGDVQLQLPATVSTAIHASSFSGNLHSDFGTVSEHEHGSGSELDVRVGSGSGKIRIETFSGDLRVRKLDSH